MTIKQSLEIEVRDKQLSVYFFDDGDVDVTIWQDQYTDNTSKLSIIGDIILTQAEAKELLEFLREALNGNSKFK